MIAKTDYEELLKKVEKLSREMKDIRQILLQENQKSVIGSAGTPSKVGRLEDILGQMSYWGAKGFK